MNQREIEVFMEPNWSDLPYDLLTLIRDKLTLIEDFIRFGAVCFTWHSVYATTGIRRTQELPVLLIPCNKNNGKEKTRCFYSLSEKRVYDLQLPLPQNSMYCCGSSFGWLAMLEGNLDMHLFNPFLSINNKIQLPPLTSLEITEDDANILAKGPCDWFVTKVVLSANPATTPDYVVMIIYGGCTTLGFCKAGDKTWTSLDGSMMAFDDVVFYKGMLYALHYWGHIMSCDVNSPHPKLIQVAPYLALQFSASKGYLVDSSGDLLQVRKTIAYRNIGDFEQTYSTVGFNIFKLDPIKNMWVEVKNLYGCTLFLGDNSSLSLLATKFPGLKPNCIYFTDDVQSRPYVPQHMGVYKLEDPSFKPHYLLKIPMIIPAPIWIEPTPVFNSF